MLKALELSGFKSFADRTRFEFPPGISVVVGPNGSGKSNLVDAVKWVLGSQSAKSLRGQEMVDVIFNGSASRGPLGTAEVTLTLDNAKGTLPIEAGEVHVTRRVYRSGEAEYLINRQPCRLRDIRDLLSGTGITTEAYCIIEQGKVDALLQSSPRERRVIFEEAAGISQFKSKKAAALRRLERVEQNLLRLSDIVDEVESRVRTVRMQAGKARRYRECANRLQELRTQVGLVDWRALTEKIVAREQQLADLSRRQREHEASLAGHESQAQELERTLETSLERQRAIEAAASGVREQIAARQAALESQRARRGELQQEVARSRRQLAAMNSRLDNTSQQFRDVAAEFRTAEAELAELVALTRQHVELARQSQTALDQARGKLDRCRADLSQAERTVTLLANQLTTLRGQQLSCRGQHEQLQKLLADSDSARDALAAQLREHEQAEAEVVRQVDSHKANLGAAEQSLSILRRDLARADKQHRQLEERLMRTRERISVLSELEERLEGLDGGVQQVLQLARDAPDGPLRGVCGVVADLFHVDVDSAPLIEMALGERAQFIVLKSAAPLLERLAREPLGIMGRVGFLRLDTRPAVTAMDQIDLSSEPGVMGRADRFIETAPQFMPLVQRLLGRTWLVDRLATAARLHQGAGRGLEFVTSDGELLASDGTLIVGTRSAVIGILSRRSELRAGHEQTLELERQLAQQNALHSKLQQDFARQEELVAASRSALVETSVKLTECRQHSAAARMRLDQTDRERESAAQQLRRCDEQLSALQADLEATIEQHAVAEQTIANLVAESQTLGAAFVAAEQRHSELQITVTEGQVASARCEERVELLRQQMEQAARDQQEKDRALADARQRLSVREAQLAEQEANMLEGGQSLAELFLRKEQHATESASQSAADESLRRRRAELGAQIRDARQQLSALQTQRHKLDVAADRLRHERQTLCERMHEDYGIDLSTIATGEAASAAGLSGENPLANRDAVEQEIADLRNQIAAIGPVNMDALAELEELESRFNNLSRQYRDLVDAKTSLERIINRINSDTRQLFAATLEAVRGHFQELFRRLFGGGEADIVLDDQEDVLECGIDIIARPPGKEACSISLLSGGEKTLTCVALLLAVFRSKPSPFCVLDEVDAALDESNIGRFVGVLHDFLSFTQFIVVTHSKKTMAGGDTLYGVTMEESGVSKRVAVRFEDVSEEGQILPAVRRAA
ncbi:MAG: chromosome segregation protein SMC [Pirellulales bacterium]